MQDKALRAKHFFEHHAKQYRGFKPQDFARVAFMPVGTKEDQEVSRVEFE
jgi:hypothetical protein